MPDAITDIIEKVSELTFCLPVDRAGFEGLSAQKRRALRAQLEKVIPHLNLVAHSLDTTLQPEIVFDPTSPAVIGELVARTTLLQRKTPLEEAVKFPFYGAGVYAIYYNGPFPAYAPVSGKDHPLYVGKADPELLHAPTPQAQGRRLFTRLKDHHRSLSKAGNLELADFECRFLVVRSAWVETAESLLIDWFRPVWNNEMKVCYGFGKHGDSASTRSNERSPWDTLHSGRGWASGADNTPNKRSIDEIQARIADHFARYPTGK